MPAWNSSCSSTPRADVPLGRSLLWPQARENEDSSQPAFIFQPAFIHFPHCWPYRRACSRVTPRCERFLRSYKHAAGERRGRRGKPFNYSQLQQKNWRISLKPQPRVPRRRSTELGNGEWGKGARRGGGVRAEGGLPASLPGSKGPAGPHPAGPHGARPSRFWVQNPQNPPHRPPHEPRDAPHPYPYSSPLL